MNVSSILVTGLAQSLSPGEGLVVPEVLVPVIELPLGLQAVSTTTQLNLTGVYGSAICSRVANIGNSSGVQSFALATLDKAIYKIRGNFAGAAYGGVVPSSASPFFAVMQLLSPGGGFAQTIANLPIHPTAGVPVQERFEFIVQLTQSGWVLRMASFIATGAAESLGFWANASIERLV